MVVIVGFDFVVVVDFVIVLSDFVFADVDFVFAVVVDTLLLLLLFIVVIVAVAVVLATIPRESRRQSVCHRWKRLLGPCPSGLRLES